jgi:hypothetical protein
MRAAPPPHKLIAIILLPILNWRKKHGDIFLLLCRKSGIFGLVKCMPLNGGTETYDSANHTAAPPIQVRIRVYRGQIDD